MGSIRPRYKITKRRLWAGIILLLLLGYIMLRQDIMSPIEIVMLIAGFAIAILLAGSKPPDDIKKV